ncbi:hypothetical protein FHS43_002665 [Streptosporangium becharense]|uniref:Uncharacterized protein n=1 Tax=Streptosporangium becharense TaxID=1816182 RepID=A0A7W9IIW8_9ACTN|nr:hypothetical protein [Streptosporangium becharense]MBB2911400.1 hypothetical protein [Streptosporangium becharense]MBB5821542.1 hypothetical protein [Streptosporangium becharense]
MLLAGPGASFITGQPLHVAGDRLPHRTGPEFADPARGDYLVEEVPLTPAGITRIDLKPEPVAQLLIKHASHLFQLPDLRQTQRSA